MRTLSSFLDVPIMLIRFSKSLRMSCELTSAPVNFTILIEIRGSSHK